MHLKSNDIEKKIGERLKFYRKQKGVSQTSLGEHVGLTFQQIQKYENGSNRLSTSRLIDFASYLDFSIEEFFDGLTKTSSKKISPLDEMKAALTEPLMLNVVRQFREIESTKVRKSFINLLKNLNEHG